MLTEEQSLTPIPIVNDRGTLSVADLDRPARIHVNATGVYAVKTLDSDDFVLMYLVEGMDYSYFVRNILKSDKTSNVTAEAGTTPGDITLLYLTD